VSIWQYPQFLRYWIGDTAAAWWGSGLQVALYWTLAARAHGAQELGWLSFWSTAPVFAGGPIAARLFDRFGVRPVMVADFGVRAGVYASLGVWLAWSGLRHTWFIDAGSAVLGLTFIANASGGPGLWPRLVPERGLPTAMKLEQTGRNLAVVGGALTGGLLVMAVPLQWLALSASAIFLAAGLNVAALSVPPLKGQKNDVEQGRAPVRPWSLMRADARLWGPLLVFWMSNLGAGGLAVVEPVMVHDWRAPAFYYGLLGAVGALMSTVGAWFWPSRQSWRPMLTRVWLMETVAGLAIGGYWAGLSHPGLAFLGMVVSAGLAGGTAVMVMQLRFEALSEDMRAVVLAYMRTVLYTAGPIGAVVAGQWIGHHPLGPAIGAAVVLSVIPSVGLMVGRVDRGNPPPAHSLNH
jgi:MFS family permease